MRTAFHLLLGASCALLLSCGGGKPARPAIVAGQSTFKQGAKPEPATFVVLHGPSKAGGKWSVETVVEDGTSKIDEKGKEVFVNGGNVFHKCMEFDPVHGEPGILTISANPAFMKIWRKQGGKYAPQVLWTGVVGGEQNRLRDVEIGDVDGDGVDELVVATHDLGAAYVFEQMPEGLVPTEIDRTQERTFVHEVELGDVNDDGVTEIFMTPSAPNKFKGEAQPGQITMYHYDAATKTYPRSVVADLPTRHAKEILCCRFFPEQPPVLFAALEGEGIDENFGGEEGSTTLIQLYRWKDGAMSSEEVLPLPGKLCRFLNCGDTDGDGQNELIASTKEDGVFAITYREGAWHKRLLVEGFVSAGFEHATVLVDWDGDGVDEIFLGSDKQKRLQRLWYDKPSDSYQRETLLEVGSGSYFIWNIMPLSAH